MPIRVNEKRISNNKPNYWSAAALGATAGFSAKYLIPVMNSEKDAQYKEYLKSVNKDASDAKKKAISSIHKQRKTVPYADEFCTAYKNKKLNIREIRKLKKEQKEQFLELIKVANQASKEVKVNGYKALKVLTKSIRPTGIFLLVGTSVALAAAFCKDVFTKTKA